ncbi:MAG: hypothetical protein ACTHKB_13650, partial [Burkholderiaceae bacterium]
AADADNTEAARIESHAQADQGLADAAAARKEVEARFAEESRGCQQRFFATSCLDDAKERRRAALKEIRAREIAADAYLRRERADERDAALRKKAEDDAARRAEAPPPKPRPEPRAERESQPTGRPAQSDHVHLPSGPTRPPREATKKPQPSAADLAAEAARRAENVKAYEEKARESAQRQREIAEKKRQKAKEEGKPIPHGPAELPPIEEPTYRIDAMPKSGTP